MRRHPPCSSVRVRVGRMIKDGKVDSSLWDNASRADKRTFMQTAMDKYGQDLAGHYSSTFTQSTVDQQDIELKGDGVYLDSPDLAAKYQHKPERLAGIKSQKPVKCPSSGVNLYEDVSLQSSFSDRQSTQTKRENKFEENEKIKGQPKQKPKVDGDTAVKEEVNKGKMTEPQEKQFTEFKSQVEENIEKMQFGVRKLKDDDDLVNTVPPIIFTEVEQMEAKVESLIADADVYKSEDNWDHKK